MTASRAAQVGSLGVRRALPRRGRRTVGPWCFLDHLGPVTVTDQDRVAIGPHPHIGLQTVTWLVAGEVVHRDSLGNEQTIRPGQLNLMTAGLGVVHAEESPTGFRGPVHGVQLWLAQPETTRHGPAAFEHHPALPRLDLEGATAMVLVGEASGVRSPARRDTDHVALDVVLRGGPTALALDPSFEHALVVLEGNLEAEGVPVAPGQLAYLGSNRGRLWLHSAEPARALVIGGAPFDEPVLMWWNFVARRRDEIERAYRQWTSGDHRFGEVASPLARLQVGPPPWLEA